MESIQNTASPHKMRKQLIKDRSAYIESVGKQDMDSLGEVLGQEDGEGNVIRIFFGATEAMPFRALGYVASAARLAQLVPAEQLQVVYTSAIGEKVNNLPAVESNKQFEMLHRFGGHMLQKAMPDVYEKTVFAQDAPDVDLDILRPTVLKALSQDASLNDSLKTKGQKHGDDFPCYGAAHTAYQDTDMLELTNTGDSEAVTPERIVAIGCQQERTFYNLRMAVRQLIEPEKLLPSVQVFTRHVSPPYYVARGGEPLLEDVIRNRELVFTASDHAANRDLQHFETIMNPERNHP